MIYKTLLALSLLAHSGASSHHSSKHELSGQEVLAKHAVPVRTVVDKADLPDNRKKLKTSEAWSHNLMFRHSEGEVNLKDKIEEFISSRGKTQVVKNRLSAMSQRKKDQEFQDLVKSPMEVPATNMRGARNLKMKDNFIVWTFYSDADCHDLVHGSGNSLNQCYEDHYGRGSHTFKVNKKDAVAIMLQYDTPHCLGVPSSIYDFHHDVLPFADWGVCNSGMYDETGFAWKVEYTTTFPHIAIPGHVYWANTDPNMCQYQYYTSCEVLPADRCVNEDKGSFYIDTERCANGGRGKK